MICELIKFPITIYLMQRWIRLFIKDWKISLYGYQDDNLIINILLVINFIVSIRPFVTMMIVSLQNDK